MSATTSNTVRDDALVVTLGHRTALAARVFGWLAVAAGVVMIAAGATVWGVVSSQLAAEKITVAEDAAFLAGDTVDGPLSAYAQADIINHHALEASGGQTYAQLDREDPVRATMMNASFLRASLFTSVVSFGISALVIGLGLFVGVLGWFLTRLAPRPAS